MSMTRSEIDTMKAAALGTIDPDVKVAKVSTFVKIPFGEARVVQLRMESIEKTVNAGAGSRRIKIRFTQVNGNKRPVFADFTLAGKTITNIDRMICRFSGNLLSDMVTDATVGDYVDALEGMVGEVVNAYVWEDGVLKTGPNSWRSVA